MKVHAIQTGRIVGNRNALRATGWSALFRRWENFEFPAYVYIIEHPEGHIAIDTGMNAKGWSRPVMYRLFFPYPIINGEHEEIGPQMESRGLNPEDVRTVIITHLDVDHVGGVHWFPNAEILVHRPEYELTSRYMWRKWFQTDLWHPEFNPSLYDMDTETYGPFPQSKIFRKNIEIRVVPIPGHTPGQIGVIVQTNGVLIFFVGDHILRQDWLVEDWKAGNLYGIGALIEPKKAAKTTRRIQQFADKEPTVLIPAHDSQAPERLEKMETVRF